MVDNSTDQSPEIAAQYPLNLLRDEQIFGAGPARNKGIATARGELLVFVDSDVVLAPPSIKHLIQYFTENPEVGAASTQLSPDQPNRNFFSDYKNLYMCYTLAKKSTHVNFIYGSFHAIRAELRPCYNPSVLKGEDTELGMRLYRQGHRIDVIQEIQPVHLHYHNFRSWLENDFSIPSHWARILMTHRGWEQIGENKSGFAHASFNQLLSIMLAPLMLLSLLSALLLSSGWELFVSFSAIWLVCGWPLFRFLSQKRGWLFALKSVPVTWLDHLVMDLGIAHGLVVGLIEDWRNRSNTL